MKLSDLPIGTNITVKAHKTHMPFDNETVKVVDYFPSMNGVIVCFKDGDEYPILDIFSGDFIVVGG